MMQGPSAIENAIRKQLAALARDQNRRFSGAEPGRPARWKPGTVGNPATKVGFSEGAAWEFIAETLEISEVRLKTIALEKPPGAAAYAMTVPLGRARVYFKVEVICENNNPARIIGRSFHEDDPR